MKASGTVIAAAAVLLLGSTACRDRQAETSARDAKAAGAELSQDAKDAWTTTKIQAKYFADSDVKGRNVDVTTQNGVVTLRGTVDTDRAHQQAVAIARQTDGVARVDDQLATGTAATSGSGTGSGEVATDTTAPRPGSASETPAPSPAQPAPEHTASASSAPVGQPIPATNSAWITTQLEAQYFSDPAIKARNIDVSTNNGIVTLRGTVTDAGERSRAIDLAKSIDGVQRVDDQLRVQGQDDAAHAGTTAATSGATPGAEPMSDSGVTARVQSKFFSDDTVKASRIDVDTADGVVTLQGSVASEQAHRRAVQIAQSVDGVKDVRDQLSVSAQQNLPQVRATTQVADNLDDADTWITTKVQAQFFTDDALKTGRVDVRTENGIVTLTGHVGSREARERAEQIARSTSGVSRVDNQLQVQTGQ